MAVDSEDKRRSVTAILPVPNGSINKSDRRQEALLYRFSVIQSLSVTANAILSSTGNITAFYSLMITVYGILESQGYLTKSGETVLAGLVTKVE